MKFENSDHDYADNPQMEAPPSIGEEVDVVDNEDWQYYQNISGRRTPSYRNAKKPETFVPGGSTKKLVTVKRKRSIGIGANKGTKQGVGIKKVKKNKSDKESEEEPTQFEVDYIFGKRPDKQRKGKFEYRVFWKDFPKSDASWEPEYNLRFCSDTIDHYNQGQSNVGNNENEGGEEKEKATEKVEGKVTIRRNQKEKRIKKEVKKPTTSRSIALMVHQPTLKGKNKLLPTMQARSNSMVKKVNGTGRKSSAENKVSRESSPAMSNSTSDSSSGHNNNNGRGQQNNKKGNLELESKNGKNNKNNRKGSQQQQPSTSSNFRAKSESVVFNSNNIAMVNNVARSDIEGVGLIAEVVLKDGSSKKMTLESFKQIAPIVLFEYYERALGLID